MSRAWFGLILFTVMLIHPIRIWVESVMVVHMLVQLPLLIWSGWLIGEFFEKKFPDTFRKWNGNGFPGIVLIFIITTYWMVPRTLDEALYSWEMELFKFISLPFLVGIPLRHSWRMLTSLGKSFILFNYLPMFGLMAWLYIDAPIRICNNYLQSEQKVLGWGFLFITALIILYTLQRVFTDHSEEV